VKKIESVKTVQATKFREKMLDYVKECVAGTTLHIDRSGEHVATLTPFQPGGIEPQDIGMEKLRTNWPEVVNAVLSLNARYLVQSKGIGPAYLVRNPSYMDPIQMMWLKHEAENTSRSEKSKIDLRTKQALHQIIYELEGLTGSLKGIVER